MSFVTPLIQLDNAAGVGARSPLVLPSPSASGQLLAPANTAAPQAAAPAPSAGSTASVVAPVAGADQIARLGSLGPAAPPSDAGEPTPLVNCDIMFLGDFQQFGGNQAAAAALVTLLGGAVVEASYIPVPRRATVLVCTSPVSASMLLGARQTPAGLIGSPVVAWQWLVECRRTGVLQPTQPFEARPPQAPIVHVDDDDDDDDDPALSRRKKQRKSRRRGGCLGC